MKKIMGDESGDGETRMIWSPGRVNLIGDHIDYSGGFVMPMALDLGTYAVVRTRQDDLISGYSKNFASDGIITASIADTSFNPAHGWFSYALGVVDTFAKQGRALDSGFDIYLSGDIPDGAGLSSSASVELAAAVAVNELGGFGLNPTELALIGQQAENDYVGVACGIMDQLAIAEGRAGSVLLMDCESLQVTPIRFPVSEYAVVVANTNQRRSLSDSAYNERRQGVELALQIINEPRIQSDQQPLANLVAATAQDLTTNREALQANDVLPLARHTVSEQGRVLRAAKALGQGDFVELGKLMRQSHESLRDDFAVTGSNLDALAAAAWDAPGVIGARMTGAGFGGCTVNLVQKARVDDAMSAIANQYYAATGISADFFVVEPAEGARDVTSTPSNNTTTHRKRPRRDPTYPHTAISKALDNY